jgi:hypothetical protein
MVMGKRYYDFKFELNIDGQPHPPEGAAPLFQRDPFPGGHQYPCVISGERLGKYFYDVPFGHSGTISERAARNFFQSLGLSWLSNAGVLTPGVEYLLNSVEEIEFDGERLRFSGICSPVVRG